MIDTALYRQFSSSGELLYVGITKDLRVRLSQHAVRASWFKEIASISVEHFDSREEAEAAEWAAIANENPIYNIRRRPHEKVERTPRRRGSHYNVRTAHDRLKAAGWRKVVEWFPPERADDARALQSAVDAHKDEALRVATTPRVWGRPKHAAEADRIAATEPPKGRRPKGEKA